MTKVKINTMFECDGKLYAIVVPNTSSTNNNLNLNYGRSLFEIIKL